MKYIIEMKQEQSLMAAAEAVVRGLIGEVGGGDVSIAPRDPGTAGDGFIARWRVLGHAYELEVHVRSRYAQRAPDVRIASAARPTLLVVPRLGPEARHRLRDEQMNHADLTGVVWVRLPGVLIDRARVGKAHAVRWTTPSPEANPFSKKASRVLRELLAAPERPMRITEIAARTGLAVGWVSDVADSLVARGYAVHRHEGMLLTDPVTAIIDWTRTYGWRRNPQRSYRIPLSRTELIQRVAAVSEAVQVPWALTLLAAAERRIGYVRAAGPVHIYLPAPDEAVMTRVLEALYAEEVPMDGDLVILDPYYGPSTFIACARVDDVQVVSDVQLFLDLVGYPVRGLEVAERVLRSRLMPTLGLGLPAVERIMSAVG